MMRINVKSALIWLVLWLMVLLARCAPPAHGAAFDARLIGPAVEIVDENGQAVANNTYEVECDVDTQDSLISIEVRFVSGGVSLLSGDYCGAKIYIVGWIEIARIVAVASGPSVPYQIFLPMMQR